METMDLETHSEGSAIGVAYHSRTHDAPSTVLRTIVNDCRLSDGSYLEFASIYTQRAFKIHGKWPLCARVLVVFS